MRLCSSLFGNSELSLRSPNVVAHVIYIASTLLLLKRLHHPLTQVLGFVLLALNPFVLDFFSLARGYGLALGFLMLSLYLLARACEEKPSRHSVIYAVLSGAAAALAVLANYSFLTYYVPMVLVTAWIVASDRAGRRISRDRIAVGVGLLAAGALFAGFPLYKLLLLRRAGELYFGGHKGMFQDTVEGLVRASAYSNTLSPPATAAISAIVIGAALAAGVAGVWQFQRHRDASLGLVFAAILAGTAALPIVERYLFHVLWPIERAAIYYLPLYIVTVLFGVDLLTGLADRRWQLSGILTLPALAAVFLGWQLVRHLDPRSTLDWGYDGHDKDAITLVARDRANTPTPSPRIMLGDSWQMEPSLNFYRVTRGYTWLAPVTRRPVTDGHYDYVYGFEGDVKRLRDRHVRLASYSDTDTVLVRIEP